jgi:hypothetical protein
MAFQQLYYTSSEHGLGGYGGYQFIAITPGVAPAVLREVEERTVYEPPHWPAGPDQDDPEAHPVAFSYGMSEVTGETIVARAVSAGTDYSGRPGNYFVHALVTSTPEQDFGPLLPAELWGAEFWQSTPDGATELQELSGPPLGVIDRPGVQAFLDARGAEGVLPELLTAVGRAMAGERPVLVVTDDVTETAWWIAAVSYLLGDRLARQMTFTTYSHRPGYSRYHLTGVLPGVLLPEASASFYIFDLAAERTPAGGVHPLAAILVSTGVMAAPGLWQQAAAFASGAEGSLDDWLPPVAVAAGLLGRQLSQTETDAVAGWLPGAAGSMPPGLADVGLGVALDQPDGMLSDEQLHELLNLARRLPAPPRAQALEHLLAERAIAHITRGEPAAPVPFASPAVQAARDLVVGALDAVSPQQALALLEWAAACGIELPETELERFGRTRLGPDIPERELAGLVRFHPAIRRGLLRRLAGEPREVTRALLSGPVGTQLSEEDLEGQPELTELWLLESVARGRMRSVTAFDRIVDARAAAQRSPRVDAALLSMLWPHECPPGELTELLGVLTDAEAPDVLDWFAAQLGSVPARGAASEEWSALAQALAGHQVLDMLSQQDARPVRNTIRVLPLLHRAWLEGPSGNADVFGELFGEYARADAGTRRLLEQEVPRLLARAARLGRALRGCPSDLAAAFCRELDDRLAPMRADVTLARRVFIASSHPDVLAQPVLSEAMAAALEQVRHWSRHDLGALAQSMGDNAELAESFRTWRKARRGERARWRRSGTKPTEPGS